MLLFIVIPLLGLTVAVGDYLHWRRRVYPTSVRRIAAAIWYAATDMIPLLITITGWLQKDNSTEYLATVMWAVWIWMVTALPRLATYLFDTLYWHRTGKIAGAVVIVLLIWGATLGRTTLRIDRVEVCSRNLPAGFDGMRIVQLSDIHLGTIVRLERELARIIDSVNALHPEAVFFTGDLVNIRSSELDARAARLLGAIEAPVYSVMGNHDAGIYIKDTIALPQQQSLAEVIERQRALGWHVLDDESIYLHRNGDSISLSGISFDPVLRERQHDNDLEVGQQLARVYRDTPDSLYNLTLVHLPQLWDQIRTAGYGDLTLSGHVHSMQTKIRLGSWSWSPAAWLYDRWSGPYTEDGSTLYINDGTGCVGFPMRLGAWPEITLITLKRCE